MTYLNLFDVSKVTIGKPQKQTTDVTGAYTTQRIVVTHELGSEFTIELFGSSKGIRIKREKEGE